MSSKPYSPVHSPRSWRGGRFAVTRFAANHRTWPLPSDHWGDLPHRLTFDRRHLEIYCQVVPTGAILIGCCTVCGGRLEHPFPITSDGSALAPPDDSADAFTSWTEMHTNCADTPHEHTLASRARELLDRVLATGRAVFKREGELATRLHILFKDGTARAIPLYDLSVQRPHSEDRDKLLADRLRNLGAWMKGQSKEPVITVVAGEVWGLPADADHMPYPAISADRDEYLMASFTTSTFGRLHLTELPAASQRWNVPSPDEWYPMSPPSKPHDGIFALSRVRVCTAADIGSESVLRLAN